MNKAIISLDQPLVVAPSFYLSEFLPRNVYDTFGLRGITLIDERTLILAQFFRNWFGPSTINNWYDGGQYNESGYRAPKTKTGAEYSQHKFGRAFDVKVAGKKPVDIYHEILAHEKEFMQAGLTRMEIVDFTPTWNHLDIAYTGEEHIVLVKP